MKKVWLVWGVGVFAYVIAVLHRTSFGVSGLSAADRFSISPSVLSSFVVLQIVVYAGMQIPAGVLLDRYGSRIMIAVGAFIMMSAQLALAFTESLPVAIGARIAVGAGMHSPSSRCCGWYRSGSRPGRCRWSRSSRASSVSWAR